MQLHSENDLGVLVRRVSRALAGLIAAAPLACAPTARGGAGVSTDNWIEIALYWFDAAAPGQSAACRPMRNFA